MKFKKIISLCLVLILSMTMIPIDAIAKGSTTHKSSSGTTHGGISFGNEPKNGYVVSIRKTPNVKIFTKTVSELKNKSKRTITTTDKFEVTRSITFSKSCSSQIKSSISATTGSISGLLGIALQNEYNFKSNYIRKYSKGITVKVPPKKTYRVKAIIKGDKVSVSYKHYVKGKLKDKGSGIIYVPMYCSWECS